MGISVDSVTIFESPVAREPVFKVKKQVSLKPANSASHLSYAAQNCARNDVSYYSFP